LFKFITAAISSLRSIRHDVSSLEQLTSSWVSVQCFLLYRQSITVFTPFYTQILECYIHVNLLVLYFIWVFYFLYFCIPWSPEFLVFLYYMLFCIYRISVFLVVLYSLWFSIPCSRVFIVFLYSVYSFVPWCPVFYVDLVVMYFM